MRFTQPAAAPYNQEASDIGVIPLGKTATGERQVLKYFALVCAMALTACSGPNWPGPSVPSQQGANLQMARMEFNACVPDAHRAGQNAVAGSYIAGILILGVLPGVIGGTLSEDVSRTGGEYRGIDNCLAKRGFLRRDLTPAEYQALQGKPRYERERILNHLIGGGRLDGLS